MEKLLQLSFNNGKIASAVHVQQLTELPQAIKEMGLQIARPTLVIVGGASKMRESDFLQIQRLFIEVLAPVAENLGAYVVDGGTDAGVMRLMGEARTQIGAKFALIGVAPVSKVALPNSLEPPADSTPLEPNHSHFFLVPGSNWGDESPWLAQLATVLAHGRPSLTILINGGEITFQDALQNVNADRLVIVMAGSGRTADILAGALYGETTDERAIELAKSGIVHYIKLSSFQENFENLAQIIKGVLST
ncbi:hypothetical protein [Nostoc sp. UHCC 0870]|uniref:hypothetical protein n=1 Tax=Nostoc sp. UHCC 0870 TaxID=2914041 RepID=UPI001EE11E01|nr:hypothetical protein [Nostoc sp. UHCC 0870]UKO99266.1 hypothetical protein L6494_05995 [Nostoc sp. UHCC 0870]